MSVSKKQHYFFTIAKMTAGYSGYELNGEAEAYLKKLIDEGSSSVESYATRYPEARNHFIEEACLTLVNAITMVVSIATDKSSEQDLVISMKSVVQVKDMIKESKTDLRCRPWCQKGFDGY